MLPDERHHHVALPKLYGAPQTPSRPPTVAHNPRPFDPDDMPIEADQTDEERALLRDLPARAYAPGGGVIIGSASALEPVAGAAVAPTPISSRPFRLRELAGRVLGGREDSGAA